MKDITYSSSPEYVGAMNALVDNYGEGIIEKSIVTKELASSNQLSFILDYKIPGPNFDITDKLTVNIRMSISHADQTFGKPIVAITGGIRGINASDPDELIRNASAFSQAVEHVRLLIQHVVEAVNTVMERDYYKPSAQ